MPNKMLVDVCFVAAHQVVAIKDPSYIDRQTFVSFFNLSLLYGHIGLSFFFLLLLNS